MPDRVLDAFLTQQMEEGLALAAESNLLDLLPIGTPANRYLARFRCTGLVEESPGNIARAERFDVGIWFGDDYLRVARPFQSLTWLGPRNIWHPNISNEAPVICVGHLTPGTGIVDLLYQVFEIITWNKVTMREDDALNRAACQWARRHLDQFPVDGRPLKRRVPAPHFVELTTHGDVDVR